MAFLKKEYQVCLGDLTADIKCSQIKENIESEVYLISPKIEISSDVSSLKFSISGQNKEKRYKISSQLEDQRLRLYVSDCNEPITSIDKKDGVAILYNVAERISNQTEKKIKNRLKNTKSLLKSWQSDALATKETSNLLYSTLEEILSAPEIVYAPKIEVIESSQNKSVIPILSHKLLEIGDAMEEYTADIPSKYFSLHTKDTLFERPVSLLVLAAVYNLINPNSKLYSKMEDIEAVGRSLNNFLKLCEYYLPGLSTENVSSIHDELSLDPVMHRMVSGLISTKAISQGHSRYNSISIRQSKNLSLILLPWGIAYLADQKYGIGGLVYALPFAMNLILAKIGIGNPLHFGDAVYHTNHSFTEEDPSKHPLSNTLETQLLGLTRLGATSFQ